MSGPIWAMLLQNQRPTNDQFFETVPFLSFVNTEHWTQLTTSNYLMWTLLTFGYNILIMNNVHEKCISEKQLGIRPIELIRNKETLKRIRLNIWTKLDITELAKYTGANWGEKQLIPNERCQYRVHCTWNVVFNMDPWLQIKQLQL